MLLHSSSYGFEAVLVRHGSQHIVQFRSKFKITDGDLQHQNHQASGPWQSAVHLDPVQAVHHVDALRSYYRLTHTHCVWDGETPIISNRDASPRVSVLA